MNSYVERARFYNYEFNTKIDFELLSSIIKTSEKPIAEIPCGSGRLLPLHKEHNREVYMIDVEPLMIEQLERVIHEQKLNDRVKPQIGDFRFWKSCKPVETILIPRGGIQLLQNSADFNVTIKNLHGSISKNGHIYIDIAKPWNHNRNEAHLLPEFMRFSDEHILEGESVFMMDNIGELKRNFTSKINEEYVVVNFDFCAKFFDGKDSSNYNMKYQWRNITLNELSKCLSISGFKIMELYGDYSRNEYSVNSSRLICIAQKL